MQAAYQSAYTCYVDRKDEEMSVKSVFVSTDYEITAQMKVDVRSFRINHARWDAFRLPDGYSVIKREIPELIGVEAYFYSGSKIRQAVGEEINGIPLELIIECIRAVGQAEAFLIPERGHSSLKEFDDYCQTVGLNSCRYYSNLNRIAMSWGEYMGEHSYSRDEGLFYRSKSYQVFLQPDDNFFITSGFIDSFHELALMTTINPDGVVSECRGNFLRGPDKVCFENLELLPNLVGKKLSVMSKKEIAALVGGPNGCTHLFEIIWDLKRLRLTP